MNDARFPFPCKEEAILKLRQDYAFGKIPPDSIDAIIDDAWTTGETAAEEFLKEHNYDTNIDFISILREEGFVIHSVDEDFVYGNVRFFADVLPKGRKITIYTKSVKLWAEQNFFSFLQAQNIILMHEFFHYLEFSRYGYTSKHFSVPMLKLFGLEIGSTGIAALSEIAADAFANVVFNYVDNNRIMTE